MESPNLWQNRQICPTKQSLRCLTGYLTAALILAGQGFAQAPTNNPPATARSTLLSEVLARLESHASVSAKVLVNGTVAGLKVRCDDNQYPGVYLQAWDRSREKLSIRWELHGQVAGAAVSVLQVSNGDRLWTDLHFPNGRKVTDVDLRALRQQGHLTADQGTPSQKGQVQVLQLRTEYSAEQGGLPALVASLEQHFAFSPPVSLELSGVSVLGTIGTWRPEKLRQILSESADVEDSSNEPAMHALPDQLPASVLLVVGEDDLFPYVVEFRRQINRTSPGKLGEYQLQSNPLLLIRLYERDFDVAIGSQLFVYSPGDVESIDLTSERLDRLRRLR